MRDDDCVLAYSVSTTKKPPKAAIRPIKVGFLCYVAVGGELGRIRRDGNFQAPEPR
jgi:hypothetical protein